ncbi:MAG: alpha/beta hydrolase [Steroidobacteraceae bacterium]
MKVCVCVLCLLAACGCIQAHARAWQPTAGHTQIPIWPGTAPDAQPVPGPETVWVGTRLLAGRPLTAVTNVTRPTITVYAPKGRNTGAAVVVFPGGGFYGLIMALEGTEACDWLTSNGITCVLLKYRVPSLPYDWRVGRCAMQSHSGDGDCRPDDLAIPTQALEDAQRTMGLVRLHAREWRIDPHKVGVLGFSAGGYLVAEISTHFAHRIYPPVDAADEKSARPDFAIAIYPGHLATDRDLASDNDALNPNVPVSRDTPPTFLVQAEDDYVDGVKQSLVYYMALAKEHVPAELHIYAGGVHAFGLRPTKLPITHWPKLADAWLRRIGVVGN